MVENKFTYQEVNKLLGITDSYKAPDRLMEILFDREKREQLFKSFLSVDTDVSYDWFNQYFMEEHAERKSKKQDFTPQSISALLAELSGTSVDGMRHESAAGTGSMTIAKWQNDRISSSLWTYKPSNFVYNCEELSDRTVPFLIFNMLIRGMNGTVVHGDSLTREVKNVYFIQNYDDNFMGFSELNVMPRCAATEEMFDVREWVGEEIVHTETPSAMPLHLGGHDFGELSRKEVG